VDGVNVVPEVYAVKKIKTFTHEVISGSRTGFTESVYRCCQYRIGGSDLGPAMAVEALQFYKIISIFISFLMWMVTM
jgi:glucose-6-phosphate isomerase